MILKEYCIYVRQGSGMPYILKTYPDIISAKKAIERLVGYEEEKNKMYFVDNDYFYNKFCYAGNLKYMCIQVREVTEWTKYYETKNTIKNNSNIIYLRNYQKNT